MIPNEAFRLKLLPLNSAWARELCEHGVRKHYIKSLLELDVTIGRKTIRTYKASTGRDLSFFSWIIKCIADTIDQHKTVHALRYHKNEILMFDDVDISIPIEREINGKRMPMPFVMRRANRKQLPEIHQEIEDAKNRPLSKDEQVLSKPISALLLKIFPSLPAIIKNAFWRRFDRNPFFQKRIMGTVGITSVAIAGNTTAWAVPISIQPVCFALGSITKKTILSESKPEVRDYLALTVMFDHDVIDGAPAARFISQLSKNIQRGYGLDIAK
jgi:pyruvate/2-oxoglutarate dehydrogenase complex dihydrolipoamide acyltransferase (E2) component